MLAYMFVLKFIWSDIHFFILSYEAGSTFWQTQWYVKDLLLKWGKYSIWNKKLFKSKTTYSSLDNTTTLNFVVSKKKSTPACAT